MAIRLFSLWRGIQRFNLGVSVVACLWVGACALQNEIDHLSYPGHRIAGLVFTPDGRVLFGAGSLTTPTESRGELTAWDATSGRRLWSVPSGLPLAAIAVSPNGTTIATGTEPGNHFKSVASPGCWDSVRLWNANSGKAVELLSAREDAGEIVQLLFAARGRLLLVVHKNKIVTWDTRSGAEVDEFVETQGRAIAWAAVLPGNGHLVVSSIGNPGSNGNAAMIEEIDPVSGRVFRSHTAGTEIFAAVSPDNVRLVFASGDARSVGTWDLRDASAPVVETPLDAGIPRVTGVRFNRDGSSLIVSSPGNRENYLATQSANRAFHTVDYSASAVNPYYTPQNDHELHRAVDDTSSAVTLSNTAAARIADGIPALWLWHSAAWHAVPLSWKTAW